MLKVAMVVACVVFSAFAAAQGAVTMAPGGEKHWPVVQEGKTVKISPHVVGAHGEMTDMSVVSAYRDIVKTLQTRAAALKREGKSAEEAGQLLEPELKAKYPDWQQPVRVMPAVAVIYTEMQ